MKILSLVRTIVLTGSFLLQLSTACFQSRGAAGDVDLSFVDPGFGVDGRVTAFAVQPDHKVLIGGYFTTVRGLVRTNLARLNADGTGDPSFNPGAAAEGFTAAVALQPDGKVLIGGDINSGKLTRLNADGSLDSSFNPVIGGSGLVWSVALQPDGKVLIGGSFTAVNGTNRYGIARLNADGSLDNSFNPGTGIAGSFVEVRSIVVQSNDKVLIGGGFGTVDETNRHGIFRLTADGSLDGSFNQDTGLGGDSALWVESIAVQLDGKVLIGGLFTAVNGTSGIARLNADGSLDASFNAAVFGFTDGRVKSVAVQSDSKVLIGGSFHVVNATIRNRIARLNADGSLDASFNPAIGNSSGVSSIVAQSDGKVFIGGDFTTVHGTSRNAIARLNNDGSLDGSFHPGRDQNIPVSSLIVQPDDRVLIGNQYTTTRLNGDGSLESSFISANVLPPDATLETLIGLSGYDDCGILSGCACNKFTAPNAVVVQADGKVLIGGQSMTVISCYPEGGGMFNYYFLGRFNADASFDTSFGQIVARGNGVPALAVQPDGKILFGGDFIARLNADGSRDNSFNPGSGVSSPLYPAVESIAMQSDGKVLIGGNFNLVNGTNRDGIARLNADGSLDGSFNPGMGISGGSVASMALQSDGKVLIGGNFTAVNGTNRNRIARLNAGGSLDNSFNPGTGADGVVRAIALQSDGNVLIGGDFVTINGVLRPHVARLHGDAVAPSLNITRSNASVIVSWLITGRDFQLQDTTNLALPSSWSPVAQPTVTNASRISVTVPTSMGSKFFRLTSP